MKEKQMSVTQRVDDYMRQGKITHIMAIYNGGTPELRRKILIHLVNKQCKLLRQVSAISLVLEQLTNMEM